MLDGNIDLSFNALPHRSPKVESIVSQIGGEISVKARYKRYHGVERWKYKCVDKTQWFHPFLNTLTRVGVQRLQFWV